MLRTNLQAESAQDLWSKHMQLTEAEASFRALKSELSIRPLFHQKEPRVKAHGGVRFPWVDGVVERLGTARPATGAESPLQFVIHRTYHRGQVARRPRELGVESLITDYIAWIWLDCPSVAWAHSCANE